MFHWFESKNHEPAALAALIATSCALHAVWISNLIYFRLSASDVLGSLYLFAGSVWAIMFALAFVWCRAHDGGDARADRVFHFFVASVLLFAFMTLPLVYGFAV